MGWGDQIQVPPPITRDPKPQLDTPDKLTPESREGYERALRRLELSRDYPRASTHEGTVQVTEEGVVLPLNFELEAGLNDVVIVKCMTCQRTASARKQPVPLYDVARDVMLHKQACP